MTNPNTIMELQQELEILKEKLEEEIAARMAAEKRYRDLEQGIDDMVKKLTAGML